MEMADVEEWIAMLQVNTAVIAETEVEAEVEAMLTVFAVAVAGRTANFEA